MGFWADFKIYFQMSKNYEVQQVPFKLDVPTQPMFGNLRAKKQKVLVIEFLENVGIS